MANFMLQPTFRAGKMVVRLGFLLYVALLTILLASVYHGVSALRVL